MLERLRLRLASAEALPQMAMLGILGGLLAGAVIILFRLLLEYIQSSYLPSGHHENFEALSLAQRFWLPVIGGLLVGLLFQAVARQTRQVGVTHVMERLAYHQGHMPLRNTIMQFIGTGLCLASGHSVGREGPGIHLGAANGSLLGQWLHLPNNATRTLIGCGVAAAIGASFNTPLAGVIFAMEVVMMEYTIASFTPIILASVSATLLTRLVYGDNPAFTIPALEWGSVAEIPIVILGGICIGFLAAGFTRSMKYFTGFLDHWPVWQRMTLAGLFMGLAAMAVPEIMGVGYDTVNSALLGQLGLASLLLIMAVKLLATTAGLGLGLPGGLIGPTLVIGSMAGGALGLLAGQLFPGEVSSYGFYALLGMGAMMAATLQAPLAALLAMLELTANPNILLPGMLAVITAGLTSSELLKQGPIYLELMRARGLDYRNDPVVQSLRRIGVAAIMDREFAVCPASLNKQTAQELLAKEPHWLIIESEDGTTLLQATDLARHLSQLAEQNDEATDIELLKIPSSSRVSIPDLSFQANLQEALELLQYHSIDTACVRGGFGKGPIRGIVTRQEIEASYRY